MVRRVSVQLSLLVGIAACIVGAPHAQVLGNAEYDCQVAIAKAGARFLQAELRLRQRCIEANRKSPGSCAAPDPFGLQKVRATLDHTIVGKCAFGGLAPIYLQALGFPGACPDANPGDGFTLGDLQVCIQASHEDRLTGICVGAADASPCSGDGSCPGGFCHLADCRPDPLDTDSIQEGHCTTEPERQCFVNGGIARAGAAGVAARVSAAVGCVPGEAAVGLPLPFALTQPETVLGVGF